MADRRVVKLANVILEVDDFLKDDSALLFRPERGSTCAFDGESSALRVRGLVDFTTFLNGAPIGKWRRYTSIDNIALSLDVKGEGCTIAAIALRSRPEGGVDREVAATIEVESCPEFKTVTLDMPLDCAMAGFAILSRGETFVRDSFYRTSVDETCMRVVRLALCTTTYRKESYITGNIARIKAGIIDGDGPVSDGFHMFVVDNGRTLDVDGVSDDWLSVIPNDNVGGSGGFARGMIAAHDYPADFTHVVLMDDDVCLLPESFTRLHALLSLASDRYASAFVSGAMMELERPALLFEDVSQMLPSGAWQKVKPDIRVDCAQGVVASETTDVEVDYAYGGWWFNCIPMETIEQHGLPLPFFVRYDDVEYGLRCKPTYMTMSGICVWHSAFAGRFNAAVACYQFARNLFVITALYDWISEEAVLFRYWRAFNIWLRSLDYGAAELWLDALEDYLKGPEFLMAADGAELMARAGEKCEKLVDVADLDADVMRALGEVDPEWISGDYLRTPLEQLVATIPHDRHWLPDFLLSETPGAVVPGLGESATPWTKTACRTRLVALSPDGSKGCVREMDRPRYRRLRTRFRSLMKRYRKEHAAVAQRYRGRQSDLASRGYWERKLGMES